MIAAPRRTADAYSRRDVVDQGKSATSAWSLAVSPLETASLRSTSGARANRTTPLNPESRRADRWDAEPDMAGKQPFEKVVATHGATVLRVCRAVVGPVDADDAWSETFVSAMKAYPDLSAEANVEAWLVTIAHRKAIDITRAAARRASPLAELPATASIESPDSRDLDLAGALGALPAKQKQAVAYHYLGGLPYAEIAAIVGGSTDAARRAAADGITTLRRSYPGAAARKAGPR